MRRLRITVACIGLVQLLYPLHGIAQVCPIEAPDNCQFLAPTNYLPYWSSDRNLGSRAADDFSPTGELIQRVCFSPCFQTAVSGFQCHGATAQGGTPPPDAFVLKIYQDDFGLPGPLLSGIPMDGLSLSIDAKSPIEQGPCWSYSAQVAPPRGLSVTPNDCYWLEITGMGEQQSQGTCRVVLGLSGAANQYSVGDLNGTYDVNDIITRDIAFCLNSGLAVATAPPTSLDGGCGPMAGACCNWQTTCTADIPYSTCASSPSSLPLTGIDCSDPLVASTCLVPGNDLCANAFDIPACVNLQPNPDLSFCSVKGWPGPATEVCDIVSQDCLHRDAVCLPFVPERQVYACTLISNNRFAGTDGPQGTGTPCFGGNSNGPKADVWYTFTAPCSGTMVIEGCPKEPIYDSILQTYGNHTPTCIPCPTTNNQFSLACNDDACGTGSGRSLIGAGSINVVSVVENGCYTIRIGGFTNNGGTSGAHQGEGTFNIDVICNPPPAPSTPTIPAAPHNISKNRYIAFKPMDGANTSAFRFDKTTSPVGSCWVGQPDALGNAKCVSSPHFRVWSEPVIHFGDCEIVPVATYEIRSTFDAEIFSTPMTITTIPQPVLNNKFWADLVGFNTGFSWSPPNQFTNVNDVLAILSFITDATIKPTFQQANLQAISSTDPCLNAFVNTADVLAAVKAVAGDPYPFTTDPALCPVCP